MVKPNNGPSAALVLIATGYNIVQDATGFFGVGLKKSLWMQGILRFDVMRVILRKEVCK